VWTRGVLAASFEEVMASPRVVADIPAFAREFALRHASTDGLQLAKWYSDHSETEVVRAALHYVDQLLGGGPRPSGPEFLNFVQAYTIASIVESFFADMSNAEGGLS
jgi:hypothetical protein